MPDRARNAPECLHLFLRASTSLRRVWTRTFPAYDPAGLSRRQFEGCGKLKLPNCRQQLSSPEITCMATMTNPRSCRYLSTWFGIEHAATPAGNPGITSFPIDNAFKDRLLNDVLPNCVSGNDFASNCRFVAQWNFNLQGGNLESHPPQAQASPLSGKHRRHRRQRQNRQPRFLRLARRRPLKASQECMGNQSEVQVHR